MSVTVIVGAQCGDEGKGKIVDYISAENDLIIRFQGGDNAGHTVVNKYGTFKLHLIPCGIFNPSAISLVGTGTVVNPDVLAGEIAIVRSAGLDPEKVKISSRAHILMPYHSDLDSAGEQSEGGLGIGTTKRGIGPAYSGKAERSNIRFGDLGNNDFLKEHFAKILPGINERLSYYGLKPYTVSELCEKCEGWYKTFFGHITDAFTLVHGYIKEGKNVLFEGQLGIMKDIDLGTYPYVTSSNPVAAYAAVSAGIPLKSIGEVIGVAKAFSSQVGAGPFPTETEDQVFDSLRGTGENVDDEFGARTGRPRRLGWLDIPVLRYANAVNGFDELALCKIDKLDNLPQLKICVRYRLGGKILETFPDTEQLRRVEPVYETLPGWTRPTSSVKDYAALPENARRYVERIEALTGVPVKYIGTGPERDDIIRR